METKCPLCPGPSGYQDGPCSLGASCLPDGEEGWPKGRAKSLDRIQPATCRWGLRGQFSGPSEARPRIHLFPHSWASVLSGAALCSYLHPLPVTWLQQLFLPSTEFSKFRLHCWPAWTVHFPGPSPASAALALIFPPTPGTAGSEPRPQAQGSLPFPLSLRSTQLSSASWAF